jgi:hypothetical protein
LRREEEERRKKKEVNIEQMSRELPENKDWPQATSIVVHG